MLDSKSVNTLLIEVMISSKYERVFICDLSDLALQIIFDAWWASMNVHWQTPTGGKILVMHLRGDSIYTAELRRPAALE